MIKTIGILLIGILITMFGFRFMLINSPLKSMTLISNSGKEVKYTFPADEEYRIKELK